MLTTRELGTHGEQIAVNFLKEKHITPLFKNWSCSFGEIDIVCREKDTVVFVEVKTRYDSWFARKHLLETIHKKKQRKLSGLAEIFMKQHYRGKRFPDFRIDVIGILIDKETGKTNAITHLKAAISRS